MPSVTKKATQSHGTRTFHTADAEKYGLKEAIILAFLDYWVQINTNQSVNEINQVCYTYQTHEALLLQFPGFSKRTVQRTLQNLIKRKAIEIIIRTNPKVKGNRSMFITVTERRRKELLSR